MWIYINIHRDSQEFHFNKFLHIQKLETKYDLNFSYTIIQDINLYITYIYISI